MSPYKWWQKAVFYQIYPRSFADSNGDGIGDFPGMTSRLDYLRDLGIDAIWLSPHYPSPLFDCGYDIAGYTAVAPEYGSLDDFTAFLNGAHDRNIRVVLDLVLNHTSDQHPWFLESASSRDNPRRDWYIWRDGKNGGPPNNWQSSFGGSAWEYSPATGQYYYHYFFKQQPDLNWRNPEVKAAMFQAVRFWLDLGVDGFRLDAIDTIYEDPAMPDHQATWTQSELFRARRKAHTPEERIEINRQWNLMFGLQVDQPEVHVLMKELRALIDEYEDRVLVGEADKVSYYGGGQDELHMAFNFPLMRTDHLTPAWIRANQEDRLSALPSTAWPCNTLGNHDSPRVYSRYGDGAHDEVLARLSLALMLTLRGTPFLYNGEEIGMTDYLDLKLDDFKDMLAPWFYEIELEEVAPAGALVFANRGGRDKCRTPMQWSRETRNAGFCPDAVKPWLPINPNYADGVNVAAQLETPDSLLNFYRRLLRVRREVPALIEGTYRPIHPDAETHLAFWRQTEQQTCLVVLNYSDQALTLDFDLLMGHELHVIYSSVERDCVASPKRLPVAPFEIYIAEVR